MRETDVCRAADDTVGGRISLAREIAGLTISEAARGLGIQQDTWAAWECDRDQPRGNRLTMMAGLLAVSPSWLLAGVGQGPIDRPDKDFGLDWRDVLRQAAREVAALNRRIARLEATLSSGVRG